MDAAPRAAAGAAQAAARPSALRRFLANRLAAAGLAALAAIVLLALLVPVLPLADPAATEPARRLLPPLSDGHLLGTDHLGRDLLSRLLWGTRVSLAVGVSATLIAALVGAAIGLVAGTLGGVVDGALMRGIDLVMAFPYVMLAIAIVAVLGPGLLNALYAIAVVNIPFFARAVRGVTLEIARRPFVDAARLSGASRAQILFAEVLPNVAPVIVVTMSTTLGWMILETAGLSFLGLGAQPPRADLGSMLGEARALMFTAPFVSVVPGAMIFLLVVAVNLVGDGVRDVLDPRLSGGALAAPAAATAVSRRAVPAPKAPDAVLDVVDLVTVLRTGGRTFRAVGGVDLAVRPGERLALVGESGCGKSATALSLLRLVPTPPGVIEGGRAGVLGRDVLAERGEGLRQVRGGLVGTVFQDPQATLHPLMTVGEQLAEAVRVHQRVGRAAARAEAERLLERVRIPTARADAFPHELSGGMRQRVTIAMALANDPALLVADEPTTALDVTVKAQVLSVLGALAAQKGAAVLFITHDFALVSALADRVAVMYAGRIVEEGPAAAVTAAPAHPYTRRLMDCVPVLGRSDRPLRPVEGMPPALDALPPGCAFADRCPRAVAACRAADVPLAPHGEGRAVRCIRPLGEPA